MSGEPADADRPARTGRSVRPAAFLYALGLWILLAVVAIANGVFRETTLVPALGERTGHLLSTATLVVAILAVVAAYFDRTSRRYTRTELVLVGILWVCLTVPFEFVIGYFDGIPPEETLAQYDVTAGEVWIAVPLALLVAPVLFGSLLNRRPDDA